MRTMTHAINGYPAMDKNKTKDTEDKRPVRGEYKACLADMRLDKFYAKLENLND